MKKILALVCSVVMIVSMFAISTNAAVDGLTATLTGSIENISGYDYIKVVVSATIPDTLVAYKETVAGPPFFTTTYEGKMVAQVGFDIPYVDGLTYIPSMSSCADYLKIQQNNAKAQFSIYCNVDDYSKTYAGEIDELATLYFYPSDATATYSFNIKNAEIQLYNFADSSNSTPSKIIYGNSDFTVTNAVVAPKVEEPEKVPTDEAIAENIEADMTSITSEDGTVEYTNVAIFEEAFNLSDLADATAFGFKIGEKKSNYYGIKGEGTLNAVLAIYGVAGDLTVDTYKTILK